MRVSDAPAARVWRIKKHTRLATKVHRKQPADSNRSVATLKIELGDDHSKEKRSTRAPLRSPGRPPLRGRDEQERFWQAIAAG